MKKALLLLSICGALFVASCTKENTSVANVADILNIQSSDWVPINGGSTDTVMRSVPQINKSIQTGGDVLISVTFDGGNFYEPLPYVSGNINYSYTYTAGEVIIYAQSIDGTQITTPPPPFRANVVMVSTQLLSGY